MAPVFSTFSLDHADEALARLQADLAETRGGAGRGSDDLREGKRKRGAYFTPPPLARFVAERVLTPLLDRCEWKLGVPQLRVLDPSAGDGAMLAAAEDLLACRGGSRHAIRAHCLFALERDVATAQELRVRLPGANIWCVDALAELPSELPLMDAVVGNPPFVRSIRLRRDDPQLWQRLRGKLKATSHGEWDLYGAFVERALAWIVPHGRIGWVIPSRFFSARYAAPLRAHLAAQGVVEAVIDLGGQQVFADATTYAAVLLLHGDASAPIAATRWLGERWHHAQWQRTVLGAAPWWQPERAAFSQAATGPTLGEVAHIAKGTGTNADRVFILAGAAIDGDLVRAGEFVVERAATRPCLRGRDIVAWGHLDEDRVHTRCVVPYDGDRLLAPDELAQRWPLAWRYLRGYRTQLEAREGGRFAGEKFYAFGRPQNLRFHLQASAKIVIPDIVAAPRAQLDTSGALVIDSAYAVRPRGEEGPYGDPYFYLALLSSSVVTAWLKAAGVPLRGGYTRMKTAVLAPLPLPPPGPRLDAIIAAAKRGDRETVEAGFRAMYKL